MNWEAHTVPLALACRRHRSVCGSSLSDYHSPLKLSRLSGGRFAYV
jgi:hypothetical protein